MGTQLLVAAIWLAGAVAVVTSASTRRVLASRVAWIALALAAVDLSTLAWPFLRSTASPEKVYATDLVRLRPFARTTARIVVDGDRVLAGGRNVPLLARVRSFDGYDVFLLAHYARVVATLAGPDRERRLGALAVSARLRSDPAAPPGHAPWRPDAIAPTAPYVYWTDRVMTVTSEDEAFARLPAILDTDPPAVIVQREDLADRSVASLDEPTPAAEVHVRRDAPGRLDLHVRTKRAGWLVVNEFWYPGWCAFVDGTKRRVRRVNAAVQGIELPAGVHNIEFRYAPGSFSAGLAVSVTGLLLVVATACPRARAT